MENDHRCGDAADPVVDRRGGIFNERLKSVAANEDAIHGQSHRPILLHGHFQGVSSALARGAVNNSEDFGEPFACGFFAATTGTGLGNEIELGDISEKVSAQNAVLNLFESDD